MSLPTPDAQPSRYLPQQPRQHQPHPQAASPTHSMAVPGVSGPQALQVPQAHHALRTPQSPQTPPMPRTPQTPFMPAVPQPAAFPGTPFPPSMPAGPVGSAQPPVGFSEQIAHERAIDFASHSWDLATGGLKTLTAKRELPPLADRMLSGKLQEEPVDSGFSHSYAFILVLLACAILLLVSGGVVLYVMLQP